MRRCYFNLVALASCMRRRETTTQEHLQVHGDNDDSIPEKDMLPHVLGMSLNLQQSFGAAPFAVLMCASLGFARAVGLVASQKFRHCMTS